MTEKGGLVDRIFKSAKAIPDAAPGKVLRKKITLNDLKQVIEDYVRKTAGMGDPELRARIVEIELQMGPLRLQNTQLRQNLESARAGWKAAQDELTAASSEMAGRTEGSGEEQAKVRAELLETLDELSHVKGKIGALELQASESSGNIDIYRKKAEDFAIKLDESRRSEKKLKSEAKRLGSELKVERERSIHETERLELRIEELESAFDFMDILEPFDWEGALDRAKEGGLEADRLSETVDGAVRTLLEDVAHRFETLRLDLEESRSEEASKLDAMLTGHGDFRSVLRLPEIHRRVQDLERELGYLETLTTIFRPDEEA